MPPFFDFDIGNATEKGTKYTTNQDASRVDPGAAIFIIADGVGGGPAGDVASRVAVNAAYQVLLKANQERNQDYSEHQIELAIQKAHSALSSVARQAPGYQGMGTTLLILWGPGNRERFFLGHVGDCRCYLTRQGRVSLLTYDHTVLNALREAKQLPEDPSQWPPRNLLSQVLGSSEGVIPQTLTQPVSPGDFFFLCSDGIYEVLTPDTLSSILIQPHHPQLVCEAAIRIAMEHGADDNLTAVGIRIGTHGIARDLLEASMAVTVQGGN